LELKILPEIEENLFPLQDDEYKFLEESILKDAFGMLLSYGLETES